MKKIFYTLIFAIGATAVFAQTAPDFTVTDTHGNEHSLYTDYLDQNKVVILDLFFVDCPPCNDLAPFLQTYWEELQANNANVQMLSLSSQPNDTDDKVLAFEALHGTTSPAAGADGGSVEAQAPYVTGDFGEFFGYPTLIVIAPDRTVRFDPWGADQTETISLLDGYVQEALASVVSGTNDLDNTVQMSVFPSPATDFLTVDLAAFSQTTTIQVFSGAGQLVQTITTDNRQETITTSDLAAGNYFLFAKDGTTIARQQFFVVK